MPAIPDVDPLALRVQAQHLDRLWDTWIEAIEGDPDLGALTEGIGALRLVLAGTRRVRISRDQYDFWRAHCKCGWPGSPWADTRYSSPALTGRAGEEVHSGREMALREYARHTCNT